MDQEAKREEVRNLMRNAVNKEGGGPAAWDADAVEWIETTQLKHMIAALLEDVCADRPDRVIPYANAWLLENYAQEAESCRAAQAGEPLLLDWMPRIDLPLNTDGVRAYLAEVYISDIMQAIFDRAIHARPDNVVAFVLDQLATMDAGAADIHELSRELLDDASAQYPNDLTNFAIEWLCERCPEQSAEYLANANRPLTTWWPRKDIDPTAEGLSLYLEEVDATTMREEMVQRAMEAQVSTTNVIGVAQLALRRRCTGRRACDRRRA